VSANDQRITKEKMSTQRMYFVLARNLSIKPIESP